MSQLLVSVLSFLVAIGVLVAVHEYGHYWVARRLGVRVLRYSIGFGHRVFGWTSRKTGIEYWLSALPLGGYVKMLDEREAPVAEADKPFAFNRVHPWRRIAIVAAGPGVNVLFAILAYWLVFMIGVPGMKPIIDTPAEGSIAARAGLASGDEITGIGGRTIADWQDLRMTLVERGLDQNTVEADVRTPGGAERRVSLDLQGVPAEPDQLFKALGLDLYQPPATPILDRVVSGSPAARAGLESGDRVREIDGQAIDSPGGLVDIVKAHPGETITMTIERDGQPRRVEVALAAVAGEKDDTRQGQLGAAITVDPSVFEGMRTTRQLGPIAAIPAATARTWELTALSVRLIGRMIVGDISWRNVGGPIQIATVAGQSASVGVVAFISFLAFISINLALINLLPIPVLDGGHLLYYAIEWIRGQPLSEAVQAVGQQVGMAALLLLMTVAFYNDILRLLG
ncbi:RIP metalloprotease RseP [Salinisphaera japonica]|uniref:Zinc metalloprotease n=1 Tax=Salinisphaera japonica YTM-1 TaxID=1209778 RepID=A0A423PLP3_9GAMM|nr:RIP metalloprotease RseP [Salinisphaera japonica]ROO26530.1 peptidase [Salinisphaera japonica YTM-1]